MNRKPAATRRLLPTALTATVLVTVLVTVLATGVSPAFSAAGTPVPHAATATPTCEEWQTVTRLPLPAQGRPTPGSATGSSTVTPRPRTTPVCRNAPPTPFPHPAWLPETVVGGARLGATGVVVDLPPGTPAPPAVRDVAYILADLDTGAILAAKSPHAWLRPASTLKTLTALTLLPRLDRSRLVLARPEHEAAAGTRVGILAGNRYPIGKLFEALLLSSANDAAYLLADAAGGSERTAALMNEKAFELGAHDTVAVDPSGLDEAGQHSSAYDLALIGRAAMRLATFRRYVAKRDAIFPGGRATATGTVYPSFQIQNINELLGRYPGAIGIKPGRTNRAQHTFIGAATRNGRTLIVTQMGSTTGDWQDTAALLDWGFAHADTVPPVGQLVAPGAAPPRPAPSAPPSSPGSTPAPGPSGAAGTVPAPAGAGSPRGAGGPSGALPESTASNLAAGAISALALVLAAGVLLLIRRSRRV